MDMIVDPTISSTTREFIPIIDAPSFELHITQSTQASEDTPGSNALVVTGVVPSFDLQIDVTLDMPLAQLPIATLATSIGPNRLALSHMGEVVTHVRIE